MFDTTPVRWLALAFALTLAACGAPGDTPDGLGVRIDLAGDVCGVTSATATVTASDMDPVGPVALQVYGATIQGRISGIPAGAARTVTVRAYANDVVAPVYEGSTTVDIIAGQTVAASITLYRTSAACSGGTGGVDVTGTISSDPPPTPADIEGPGLAFTPSDLLLANDGTLFLLDGAGGRIRRVDLDARAILPPLVGTASATAMAVSPDGATAYLAYAGGRIDAFAVATGARSFFAAAPATVSSMIVTGDRLFATDGSGAWNTQALFDRATGARVSAVDWRDASRSQAFSPANSKVYFLDAGVSPTDVHMVTLDLAAGVVGADTDSPYHGDYSLPNPIRLLPDETGVIVGSGLIFEAADLRYRTALGLTFDDVAFVGGQLYLADTVGASTQVLTLSASFDLLAAETHGGTTLGIFAHGGGLALVTQGPPGVQVRFLAP